MVQFAPDEFLNEMSLILVHVVIQNDILSYSNTDD